ncbi:Elongator subunit elp4 [Yamadazyma tenuis]|uniref:Elongator complex protein 4 n=1 Tax=Candida tenuis (strain ATCC 10573 / BCRC 21748 / CBS 615 / JCM 9827 / NBRC 10315 / NRRL Y-1498 / VKM Y-70) TaxID=590646 RepID=G3AZP1_CANTC|nr:PAXNEB-domain-containing protein [Yamadazyma tenuis ATCC 10573]EGV65635.1 PAXNEB-domain-containing protein [Yamadazyma tenuis ATCC 10573]WEJ96057.1 Elongator subunit elp4 [Yamadazyma tenuis]
MSFRKRSEVINGTPRTPAVPGRAGGPSPIPGRTPTPGVPGRIPSTVPGRGPLPGRSQKAKPPGPQKSDETVSPEPELSNIGIRPSVITSQPTISTGTADLDKILAHQGLPLGASLLIEESGTTDFGSILLRCFAAQGILHNRVDEAKKSNAHVIVVGLSHEWAKDLPGMYKGSSKDKKKALIKSEENKINVSNMSQSSNTQERDLKIAWRYGLNKKVQDENLSEVNENYNHQFDITERLRPVPSANEMTFIQLSTDYKKLVSTISATIEQQIKAYSSKTIRLVIPNLLIPSIYPPSLSQSTFMIPFFHSLRSLLRQYPNHLSMAVSLPVDLYPRSSHLITTLENLVDSVIHLQPFNQAMSQLIERAYKNEPGKIQHGLVNILKLPVLAERGLMTIHNGEYAFKNGRKRFEIEEWGIPIEDDATDANNTPSTEGHVPEKQTSKNIDF